MTPETMIVIYYISIVLAFYVRDRLKLNHEFGIVMAFVAYLLITSAPDRDEENPRILHPETGVFLPITEEQMKREAEILAENALRTSRNTS